MAANHPNWIVLTLRVLITMNGGALFADMDGRGKVPLVAQSEAKFSVSQLFVKHVSDDYRFTRKQ